MKRLLSVAVPLALALAGVAVATREGGPPGPGPLQGADGFDDSRPVPVGEPYYVASVASFLDNRGKEPITIDRVRLVGVAGPLELLEVRTHEIAAGVEGKTSVYGGGPSGTYEAQFPTDPFEGHNTVPVPKRFSVNGNPDEGRQLIFKMLMTAPGIGRFEAMEVEYRAGNKRHRESFPWSSWLCAPRSDYVGPDGTSTRSCPMEAAFGPRTLSWPVEARALSTTGTPGE